MDDTMINGLIVTVKDYIVSTIDPTAKEGVIEEYKQFEWSVSLLVQYLYLNRQESSTERIPITVQAMIQQMRGAYYATY